MRRLWAHRRKVFAAAALALACWFAAPPRLLDDTGFSRAVYDRHGGLMRLSLAPDDAYRLFTPLDGISPELKQAVLLHEDRHFYAHPGINPLSLARAAGATYLGLGPRQGASTVTMQLARIRYGLNTRWAGGKIWQILHALRLELHYGKDALLEAYLNLAPYGRNIAGVGAASHIYFGKAAAELTLPEALTLAVVPQSPSARAPGRSPAADRAVMAARNRLYARYREAYPDAGRLEAFFKAPLHAMTPADLPFAAPHLSLRLLQQQAGARIHTTLDPGLQALLTRMVAGYVRVGEATGMVNASALLVDVRSAEVRAAVGSADFFSRAAHGQVDGTRARRSPGSALKPFVYALAFQQGLIHPNSVLKDAPFSFGDYTPGNFDGDFLGPVTAREALIKSRNIPALYLASQLARPDFYGFLRQAGIGRLRPKAHYGLSLALGGAELTMEELARLYLMLAADGLDRPLRYLRPDGPAPAPRAVLTPEAAFLALDILKDTPAPLPDGVAGRSIGVPVYWKTGTSNAYRDAWSAGVAGPYVLVVWVGDFRGRSSGGYVGVKSAAPLFFDIVQALYRRERFADLIQPKAAGLSLARVPVCRATGGVNDPACAHTVEGWFIPGVSPLRGAVAAAGSGTPCWSSDIRAVYAAAGMEIGGCAGLTATAGAGEGPRITSPARHITYTVRYPLDEGQKIRLAATLPGDVSEGFWFLGERFLGRVRPGETLLLKPEPGDHTVRLIDGRGRSDSRVLRVRWLN